MTRVFICRTSASLLKLVELMLMDTVHVLKILCELNVVPLALQITAICGNIMVGGLGVGVHSNSSCPPVCACLSFFLFNVVQNVNLIFTLDVLPPPGGQGVLVHVLPPLSGISGLSV